MSSADVVLEMSGVRGVGGMCEICMCLAWGGVGVRVLALGFTNRVGTGGVWDMCLSVFGLRWCGLGHGLEGWSGVTSVL